VTLWIDELKPENRLSRAPPASRALEDLDDFHAWLRRASTGIGVRSTRDRSRLDVSAIAQRQPNGVCSGSVTVEDPSVLRSLSLRMWLTTG